MARHNILGKEGEQVAVNYLKEKGYHILDINWRCRHLELDIVAEKGNDLVIVEVKTRSWGALIRPEEAVTPQKTQRLLEATEEYIYQHQIDKEVRLDIIAITGKRGDFQIEHIENYYMPH